MRFAVATALLGSVLCAQEPAKPSLRDRMPVFTHESADKAPYRVDGRLGPLWFRLVMRSAHDGSLILGSIYDGTPYFVADGKSAVVLDILEGKVYAYEEVGFEMTLRAAAGELEWKANVFERAFDSAVIELAVDTRSFFDQLENPLEDARGVFGMTKQGGVLRAQLPGRMVLVGAPPERPRIDLRFSDAANTERKRVTIPNDATRVTQNVAQDCLGRMGTSPVIARGLADRSLRDEIARLLQREIDWRAVAENYARLSADLRRLYGPGPAIGAFERADRAVLRERRRKLLEEAAAQDDVRAQTELGRIRFEEHKYEEAVRWLTPAAEAEHGEAQALLWLALGCMGNEKECDRWIEAAYRSNRAAFATALGRLCEAGRTVNADWSGPEKTEEAYRLAAKAGFAPGQYRLGAFLNGQGKVKEGADWLMRAAKQGHGDAAAQLGTLLLLRDWQQDDAAVLAVVRDAARRAHPRAQAILSSLLARGKGAPKDLTGAYVWAVLAVENGETVYTAARNRIAGLLAPEQKAAAEAKLNELRAQE